MAEIHRIGEIRAPGRIEPQVVGFVVAQAAVGGRPYRDVGGRIRGGQASVIAFASHEVAGAVEGKPVGSAGIRSEQGQLPIQRPAVDDAARDVGEKHVAGGVGRGTFGEFEPGRQPHRRGSCSRHGVGAAAPHAADRQPRRLLGVTHDAVAGVQRPGAVRVADQRCGRPVCRRLGSREEVGIQRWRHESFIVERLQLLDVGQAPVRMAAENQGLGLLQGRGPVDGRQRGLLPGQAGVEIGNRAVRVVEEMMPQAQLGLSLRSAHAAHVETSASAGADGFRLGVRADPATGVCRPNIAGVVRLHVLRPPVFRVGQGEGADIQRRVEGPVVCDTKQLMGGGQAPVGETAQRQRVGIGGGGLPGHLPAIGLLPHAAGVAVVGDASGIRKDRRMERVVGVFPENRRESVGLARIR